MKIKHRNSLLVLIIVLFACFSVTRTDAGKDEYLSFVDEYLPVSFPGKSEALKQNCVFVSLKDPKIYSCFLMCKEPIQSRLIGIYEKENDGSYSRREILSITSWYALSKVDFVDLIGNGRKFIHVLFEGNTGTGTLQMLDMYVGWNDRHEKFEPVFLENKNYRLGDLGSMKIIVVKKKIKNKGSPNVSIELIFKHTIKGWGGEDGVHRWKELFKWNDSNFSFYRESDERDKVSNFIYPIQKCIAETRMRFIKKKPDVGGLGVDELNELNIMDCI